MEYSEQVGRNLQDLGNRGETVLLYHRSAPSAACTPIFSKLPVTPSFTPVSWLLLLSASSRSAPGLLLDGLLLCFCACTKCTGPRCQLSALFAWCEAVCSVALRKQSRQAAAGCGIGLSCKTFTLRSRCA